MIRVTTDELLIIIKDNEPEEKRNLLIKAIAAAIRWKANYRDKYKGDDENLLTLSQLLEELTGV